MSDKSSYPVPAETIETEQEIKKSRFIATVGHAPDKDSAVRFIEEISAKHSGASHNTYAFIAGNPNGGAVVGFNDDGEIGGTAGKPILSVLQMRGIGEVVAVVTRYFGGTRLGTGGLVRAYAGTITMALNEIKLIERVHLVEIKIVAGYEFENSIRQVLDKMGVIIKDALYTQEVSILADIPEAKTDEIKSEIMNSTRGQAIILFT
ncbi:MAG: YigZ family protein [Candidatus Dadabacteria bacterium]|nr:YigZ family protein [Candidatus Dadabacteria bacterium]